MPKALVLSKTHPNAVTDAVVGEELVVRVNPSPRWFVDKGARVGPAGAVTLLTPCATHDAVTDSSIHSEASENRKVLHVTRCPHFFRNKNKNFIRLRKTMLCQQIRPLCQ